MRRPQQTDEERALLRASHWVREALADPRWEFRTIEGIALDTQLPEAVVRDVLAAEPALARKSAMTDHEGRDLFTVAERRLVIRERLERARWMLAR